MGDSTSRPDHTLHWMSYCTVPTGDGIREERVESTCGAEKRIVRKGIYKRGIYKWVLRRGINGRRYTRDENVGLSRDGTHGIMNIKGKVSEGLGICRARYTHFHVYVRKATRGKKMHVGKKNNKNKHTHIQTDKAYVGKDTCGARYTVGCGWREGRGEALVG